MATKPRAYLRACILAWRIALNPDVDNATLGERLCVGGALTVGLVARALGVVGGGD